jgi:TM2 domain-containing membrane protein YozV
VAPKSVGTAYILWAFFSLLGVHQFYLGKIGRGISMLLTLGWLGIGILVDLFTLESQVTAANRRNGLVVQYVRAH